MKITIITLKTFALAPLFLLASLTANALDNTKNQILDYQDVFNIEYAANPIFTHDGKRLIYERRSMDIQSDRLNTNIWFVDLKTGDNKPLISDGDRHYAPVLSPDGRKLAYLSNKDGSTQLYIRWLQSGEDVKVTQLEYSPNSITWSPDSKSLAFSMFTPSASTVLFKDMPAKPKNAEWAGQAKVIDTTLYRSDGRGFNQAGFSQLYVIDAIGGTPRQITQGDFNHSGRLSYSKDASAILFSADRHPDAALRPLQSDIFSVSVDTGAVEKVTSIEGPESNPMLSPDGKHIAFLWVNDRKLSFQVNQLMVKTVDNSDSNQATSLTPTLDRTIQDVQWAHNSKGLYFSYIDEGETKLAYVSIKGKLKEYDLSLGGQAIGRPYTSGDFTINKSGDIAFTKNDPQRPADIWLLDGKKQSQLTRLNEDAFAHKVLAQTQAIGVSSSIDKLNIPAWIALPPNFDPTKKYPFILEIHGGPHAAYGDTFSMEVQLMAAKGYVVAWANPRGSSSYGEDFGNEIHHNYPSNDYQDLMDVVDAVIAKGYIDTNNLFITGGSGGGVLTAWSIGKTDRFAAAVVAKPVINWMSFALTADAYPYFSQYWMPDMPWNINEHLWKHSPLSLVGNVKTPTMLLTGEADYRTPMSETEQYYQALRLQKIDSAMVRIPGASHGIAARPSHLIQKIGNIVAWFEKYKK